MMGEVYRLLNVKQSTSTTCYGQWSYWEQ